jgi:hypothetical protein
LEERCGKTDLKRAVVVDGVPVTHLAPRSSYIPTIGVTSKDIAVGVGFGTAPNYSGLHNHCQYQRNG